MVHLKFLGSLCREQMENGRYFVHGHPGWATSWATSPIGGLLEDERVKRVRADQCMYGAQVQFWELIGEAGPDLVSFGVMLAGSVMPPER